MFVPLLTLSHQLTSLTLLFICNCFPNSSIGTAGNNRDIDTTRYYKYGTSIGLFNMYVWAIHSGDDVPWNYVQIETGGVSVLPTRLNVWNQYGGTIGARRLNYLSNKNCNLLSVPLSGTKTRRGILLQRFAPFNQTQINFPAGQALCLIKKHRRQFVFSRLTTATAQNCIAKTRLHACGLPLPGGNCSWSWGNETRNSSRSELHHRKRERESREERKFSFFMGEKLRN